MGARGAVEIIFRGLGPEQVAKTIRPYEDRFAYPYVAAQRLYRR